MIKPKIQCSNNVIHNFVMQDEKMLLLTPPGPDNKG